MEVTEVTEEFAQKFAAALLAAAEAGRRLAEAINEIFDRLFVAVRLWWNSLPLWMRQTIAPSNRFPVRGAHRIGRAATLSLMGYTRRGSNGWRLNH